MKLRGPEAFASGEGTQIAQSSCVACAHFRLVLLLLLQGLMGISAGCQDSPTATGPRTLRVKADGSGAFPSIKAAMERAESGDVISLAPGTYTWTAHAATTHSMIVMKSGVTLLGEAGPEATIIDAEDIGRVVLCEGAKVRIEGVTLQHGVAIGVARLPIIPSSGGAIYADETSELTIVNSVIRNNRLPAGYGRGAGIYCFRASMRDCEIYDNTCRLECGGVGIYCLGFLELAKCRIRNHFAWDDGGAIGGGVVALEGFIEDSWFESNQAIGSVGARGGALALDTGTVRRCVFINNRAEVTREEAFEHAYGGAVGVAGTCKILGCIFAGNVAIGGGLAGAGGAIGSASRDPLEVWRCTLIGNQAGTRGSPGLSTIPIGGVAAVNGTLSSSIVAWNEGLAVNGAVVTRCTDFFGNTLGDSLRGQEDGGNFSADPLYCAGDPILTRDFSLRSDSPCVPGAHPNAGCGLVGASLVGCPSPE